MSQEGRERKRKRQRKKERKKERKKREKGVFIFTMLSLPRSLSEDASAVVDRHRRDLFPRWKCKVLPPSSSLFPSHLLQKKGLPIDNLLRLYLRITKSNSLLEHLEERSIIETLYSYSSSGGL
jgi:hypothetical protein